MCRNSFNSLAKTKILKGSFNISYLVNDLNLNATETSEISEGLVLRTFAHPPIPKSQQCVIKPHLSLITACKTFTQSLSAIRELYANPKKHSALQQLCVRITAIKKSGGSHFLTTYRIFSDFTVCNSLKRRWKYLLYT